MGIGSDMIRDEPMKRVLDFWFGPEDSPTFGAFREAWFKADPAFDQAVYDGFFDDYRRAAAHDSGALMATAKGCLALVILLDQFPRNMFRGSVQAFATDAKARAVADAALARGFDTVLLSVQRLFLYLPFEHSEDLADQDRSLALFEALGDPQLAEAARRHRDVINRFGRFPHRNAVLGRTDTAEERAYLAAGKLPF